ncbi:MAG TPA: hypothetical protein VGH20_18295 [Myxococcales bacterium]
MKAFVKKHYCGTSPFGDGPEESCDLPAQSKPVGKIAVQADWRCDWNGKRVCVQKGRPPAKVRTLALRELHRLGLPPDWSGSIYFTVWNASGWRLIEAYASRIDGDEESLCQVILLARPGGDVVLREVPFAAVDVDGRDRTTWSPVDVIDIDGDGAPEVVLEGDAYEDHWLEVIQLRHGKAQTIFSGLGYGL